MVDIKQVTKEGVSVKSKKKENVLVAEGREERWFGEGNGVAVI